MLGPFTFTFTLESEEFEKFEKVGADLYQPMITTRAPDGANKLNNEFAVQRNAPLGKDPKLILTQNLELMITVQ